MSKELILTDANFDQSIAGSELPILVDFWAPWCGPCRFVGPVLSEIAEEKTATLRIGKLNVDDNQMTAAKFQVTGIPTMILFKDGKQIERIVGAMPKQALEAALSKHLD